MVARPKQTQILKFSSPAFPGVVEVQLRTSQTWNYTAVDCPMGTVTVSRHGVAFAMREKDFTQYFWG